jgi:hypothetical protein
MAQALLGGLLPAIYSKADELKRGVYGLLTNPQEQAQRAAQSLLQSRAERQALMGQAFANPDRPFQVTDQAALGQLGENVLTGELGFAPAGIIRPEIAKAIQMPVTLPTDDIFQKAVANTPNAQITEDGLLLNVMRKQKPQQAMTESVRGGVFYLPEGASQVKYYGGKDSMYGGTEVIEGQTLYKNPLFVKGATGGKAPETAYDQILGKGSYEAMRTDALRVRHPELISDKRYNLSDAITPDDFLAKYAPDLEGYGDYIFSNSRQGNQLAYALQEAAVAQKVRDAGYDSVIGHSKKKGKPTISEIFDVRESHYPDAYGDYQLMPKFESLLD